MTEDRLRQTILKRLVQGEPADVMLSSLESTGEDTREVFAAVNSLHRERRSRAQALERSRSHAYWMTGIMRRLSRFRASAVDVVDEIRSDVFYDAYYAGNRPLVFSNAASPERWACRWAFDAIKSSFGDSTIEVSRWPSWSISPEASRLEGYCETVQLAAYVDDIRSAAPQCWYLTSLNGAHRGPLSAVTRSLTLLPDVLPPAAKELEAYIFMGPPSAVTHLHYDPCNVLIFQVLGSKRFALFAPHEHPFLYEDERKTSKVDIRSPDHERFRLYRFAQRDDVTLTEGQALFIPVGWWHFAESLEACLSISTTTFRNANSYPNDTF